MFSGHSINLMMEIFSERIAPNAWVRLQLMVFLGV